MGARFPAGGTRHQVVVTEPHPDLAPERVPMVFDVLAGIYWRPEEGGLLWGMSNPDEPVGEAREFDHDYFARMRARVAELVPVTGKLGVRRSWAATIDFTPTTCRSSAGARRRRPGRRHASWPPPAATG